jgi:hypothetical protein
MSPRPREVSNPRAAPRGPRIRTRHPSGLRRQATPKGHHRRRPAGVTAQPTSPKSHESNRAFARLAASLGSTRRSEELRVEPPPVGVPAKWARSATPKGLDSSLRLVDFGRPSVPKDLESSAVPETRCLPGAPKGSRSTASREAGAFRSSEELRHTPILIGDLDRVLAPKGSSSNRIPVGLGFRARLCGPVSSRCHVQGFKSVQGVLAPCSRALSSRAVASLPLSSTRWSPLPARVDRACAQPTTWRAVASTATCEILGFEVLLRPE